MEGFRRKRLFFHEKRHSVWAKILFTVAISCCIILLTCHGLNRLMADSKEEEKRSLEEAIDTLLVIDTCNITDKERLNLIMGLRTIRKYIDAIADTNNKKGNQL